MAQFDLKGKWGKRPLERTMVYRAIQGKPKFHVDQSIIIIIIIIIITLDKTFSSLLTEKAMPIL